MLRLYWVQTSLNSVVKFLYLEDVRVIQSLLLRTLIEARPCAKISTKFPVKRPAEKFVKRSMMADLFGFRIGK